MDAKYTPGPWRIGSLASWDGYTGRPFGNVWAGDGDEAVCIARAIGEGSGPQLSDVDADARLIAAAPDLLEALRKYELPIDINNIALSCIEFGSEAVERELQRRAAIAKATGEPQ